MDTKPAKTKSQLMAAEIAASLRARKPIILIVTREESRVQGYLVQAAAAAGYVSHFWDIAQGATALDGRSDNIEESNDPGVMLRYIRQQATDGTGRSPTRDCWIMRDLPIWLTGITGAVPCRQLRNHASVVAPNDRAQPVIILSPSDEIPPELAGLTTVVQWPLPDRIEIGAILDSVLIANGLPALENGLRESAIDAAVGLDGEAAQNCYATSLVLLKRIDVASVASEKKRAIAKGKTIEWIDPLPGGLDSVGGLDAIKTWVTTRKQAYSPKARAYGLPYPKGIALVGISGCGKSFITKAIAPGLGLPIILRLDFGALKSKYVGSSESNLRDMFATIDAVGPCLVWIDEIEKSMQGATSGSSDGGVAADQLGAFLTWMQERQGGAFVVATANDVSALPPEFLRKGRWDEIFWIDLPTTEERQAVLKSALGFHGRSMDGIDGATVAASCVDFTGAEIAALVPDALFAAFEDKARPITTQDLCNAARATVPLAKQSKAKIDAMRANALGRFRPATSITTTAKTRATARVLDIA